MTERRELGRVAALHAALAALSFAPVWSRFETALYARTVYDLGTNLWVLWWGPEALLRGLDPFVTTALYHPAGSRLTVDANLPLWLSAAPLRAVFGVVGSFNALAAFSFAATGVAAYALLRRFSESRAGCQLGSIAFAYSSYRGYAVLSGYGEMLQTQWAVLLALACVDHARAPRGRRPAVAAAALVAAVAEPRTSRMTALLRAAAGAWAAARP
ncbi:MAG: hypothetical protein SF051_02760, partial [Elusimicrobiota bacterium]|nr:hypothetical protein [Elusimicrobiota bacterium]